MLIGYLAFGTGVEGNRLLFLAAVLMGSLLFVSLGYLLAGLSSSEEGLMAISQIVNFPMMFLSGSLFPLEMLPDFFRPVTQILVDEEGAS